MDDIILFEAGKHVARQRIKQGLKPIVRIEVKRWKHLHMVLIKVRLESTGPWVDVMMTTKPVQHLTHRQWDMTAREMWQVLTETESIEYRHAYLTQHLSHLMYTYEADVADVARKKDLI